MYACLLFTKISLTYVIDLEHLKVALVWFTITIARNFKGQISRHFLYIACCPLGVNL